ncbi:MAG: SpoIIE family protein phosphatase [Candidatus Wallbacteria bacterium]|nr:SpoIIE family protein phosphatase [Candidatus Wallbacteria bacterium]
MIHLSPSCMPLATPLHQAGITCKAWKTGTRRVKIAIVRSGEIRELAAHCANLIVWGDLSPGTAGCKTPIIDILPERILPQELSRRIGTACELVRLRESVCSLKQKIIKQEEELSTIHAFEENIKTTFILEELLKMIVDVITRVLGCQKASVVVLQEEGHDVMIKGHIGIDGKKVENFQIKYRGRVTKEVIRRKSSLLFRDSSRLDWIADEARSGFYHTNSFLSVPIMVDNEVTAIINVTDKSDRSVFDDTDRRLLEIISSQVGNTIQRFRMSRELVEKERMAKELQVAREIQLNLLPDHDPDLSGVEVAFFYQPAFSVGGDYFDFIEIGEDVRIFLIGDVSGKGVPASLLMVMVRSIVRYAAQKGLLCTLGDIASELNAYLLKNSAEHMFMTLFIGMFDRRSGILSYTNAGHNYPLVLTGNSDFLELKTGNLFLGMFENISFDMSHLPLASDDLLILYSDGITDAGSGPEGVFGETRLRQFFRENYSRSKPLQQTINEFKSYFDRYNSTVDPHDDATLILIRRCGV